MSGFRDERLAALKAKIAALEAGGRGDSESLPFGDCRVDRCFPGGGLPLGQWHEFSGEGMDLETCAAPAAFAALTARPLARRGAAIWVLRRDDLFAPGLAGLGFPTEGLIQVWVRDETEALAATEDALATAGVAAVFAETERVELTAGRRLQLACEKHGATGFIVLRRPFGGEARQALSGSAAASRWKIASAPSVPSPPAFGLGPPRWRVQLERCRGGQSGTWLMEAKDAYSWELEDGAHSLRLVAELGDRELATSQSVRLFA